MKAPVRRILHEDRKMGFTIYEDKDGVWWFHDQRECNKRDV